MKVISLNVWCGVQGKIFFDYIAGLAATTDIFCFQEVTHAPPGGQDVFHGARTHLLAEIKEVLPDFEVLFAPAYQGYCRAEKVDFEISEGLAMFYRNNIEVSDFGSAYIGGSSQTVINEDFQNEPNKIQWAEFLIGEKSLAVYNVHGMWYPGEKTDTPERLEQSEKILSCMEGFKGAQLLCGDFNLLPETQSIHMIEGKYKNLIKEFNIISTRNEESWKQYSNVQHFADYTFVSPDVKVKSFEVPYNLVSDHLPMILDFEI